MGKLLIPSISYVTLGSRAIFIVISCSSKAKIQSSGFAALAVGDQERALLIGMCGSKGYSF